MGSISILVIVEEDNDTRNMLVELLASMGYIVLDGASCDEGMGLLSIEEPVLALLDFSGPCVTRPYFMRSIRDISRRVPVLAMSSDKYWERVAWEAGACEFLHKPFTSLELIRKMECCNISHHLANLSG